MPGLPGPDDPGIATGIRRLLEREGHAAIVVMNGALVAPTWQRHQQAGIPFDVALLDLVQPTGIGGMETLIGVRLTLEKGRQQGNCT